MSDYELTALTCPNCGNNPVHSRSCNNFCNEGYFDEADDDPINFLPGESEYACSECLGTGTETWCPKCGKNLSRHDFADDEEVEI